MVKGVGHAKVNGKRLTGVKTQVPATLPVIFFVRISIRWSRSALPKNESSFSFFHFFSFPPLFSCFIFFMCACAHNLFPFSFKCIYGHTREKKILSMRG